MTKKNKSQNPKVLWCTFGLIILLISFSFIKKEPQKAISKTYLRISAPIFKPDASYFIYTSSFAVIDYKNYLLYEFDDIYDFKNGNKPIVRTIKHSYFLFEKKNALGYFYESLESKVGTKMKTDSILGKRAYYGKPIFTFDADNMVLLDSKKNKDSFKLIEIYKCKSKIDHTYPDTTIIYYTNKMKNAPLCLSEKLDSVKKLKVKKIRAIYNSQFVSGNPNKFPVYEFKFELQEDQSSNLDKYKSFIDEKIDASQ